MQPIDQIIERYNERQEKYVVQKGWNIHREWNGLIEIFEKETRDPDDKEQIKLIDFLNPLREPELGLYKTLIGDEMVCIKCGEKKNSEFTTSGFKRVSCKCGSRKYNPIEAIRADEREVSKHKFIARKVLDTIFDESSSEALGKAVELIYKNMMEV